MARTAVIAGTATAVSNRVSRRQQQRWAAQDQAAYAQYRTVEAPPAGSDIGAELDRLADMRARGQLTDDEFAAAKAKLLGI